MTDVNTMVERLEGKSRECISAGRRETGILLSEAAALIRSLAAEREEWKKDRYFSKAMRWQARMITAETALSTAEEALEPFAAIADEYPHAADHVGVLTLSGRNPKNITVGHLRRARAAGRREG